MEPNATIDVLGDSGGAMVSTGDAGARLLAANGDISSLRPYIGRGGYSFVDRMVGYDKKKRQPIMQSVPLVGNAATLRKDEWIDLDRAVVRAARPELRIWGLLEAAGLGMTVPGGMAVTVLQYQAMTDAGQAQLDMDAVADSNRDRVTYDLRGLPLPISHGNYNFTLRDILTSRRFGTGIDYTMAEQTTRKSMELIENLTLGVLPSYYYGGYNVYGFRNYPYRVTKTFTLPTAAGWTPDLLITELLAAIQTLRDLYLRGPYALLMSPGFVQYLDNDYSAAYKTGTLRQRIMMIDQIKFLETLDYMPNFELLLVQLSTNTIRAVTFMETTPLQWESKGGLVLNNKVMTGKVPMLRANTQLNTGIVHGTFV